MEQISIIKLSVELEIQQIAAKMKPESSHSKQLAEDFQAQAPRNIIRDHRNQELFDCPPAEEIRRQWSLPPSLEKVTVCCIISYRSEELLQLPLKSHIEAEEEHSMRPLDDHISFWSFFLQQVFLSLEPFTSEMVNFLHEFVGRYKYWQLVPCRPLQCKVINVLELSARSAHSSKQFREKLLKWVGGPQCINLIYQCLPDNFLPCDEFPFVYQVIIDTLKLKQRRETNLCCKALQKFLSKTTFDEVEEVDFRFYCLTKQLLEEGRRCLGEEESIENITDAIFLLLNQANQVKILRDGLASLLKSMLTSKVRSNIIQGLYRIQYITQTEPSSPYSQQLCLFLGAEDRSLLAAVVQGDRFLRNEDSSIKIMAYQILFNVVVSFDKKLLGSSIFSLLLLSEGRNLEQFLHFILPHETDQTVIYYIQNMLEVAAQEHKLD